MLFCWVDASSERMSCYFCPRPPEHQTASLKAGAPATSANTACLQSDQSPRRCFHMRSFECSMGPPVKTSSCRHAIGLRMSKKNNTFIRSKYCLITHFRNTAVPALVSRRHIMHFSPPPPELFHNMSATCFGYGSF